MYELTDESAEPHSCSERAFAFRLPLDNAGFADKGSRFPRWCFSFSASSLTAQLKLPLYSSLSLCYTLLLS